MCCGKWVIYVTIVTTQLPAEAEKRFKYIRQGVCKKGGKVLRRHKSSEDTANKQGHRTNVIADSAESY